MSLAEARYCFDAEPLSGFKQSPAITGTQGFAI
jgi:hypothetical protein